MEGFRPCKRCSTPFRVIHGNMRLCEACRSGRPSSLRPGVTRTFGVRRCDVCWREFTALAENQRYCGSRCKGQVRVGIDRRRYANPQHRGARKRWVPVVATGRVRCRRGSSCKFAEFIDGQFVGGLIPPGRFHLGHFDGEGDPVTAPEHVECNTATSRLAAKARRAY